MNCLINKLGASAQSSKDLEKVFDNNLLFYTILKGLMQCKLSDRKKNILQSSISKMYQKYENVNDFRNYFLTSESIVGQDTQARGTYENLFNLLTDTNYSMWVDMMNIGIDLLFFKDLMLQEAKAFTAKKQKDLERNIKDHLSIEYDVSNLSSPYGQKVFSSLLVFALTNSNRKNKYLLETSNQTAKEIDEKIKKLTDKYLINCNNIFMLIANESVSQSIKSTAGASYEDRVEYMVKPLVTGWHRHSHDKNIKAMEYDFTFNINDKVAGISAKRTLRERYKQNHENVEALGVDYVFLFTLGTDLNEDKLNSILQKNGTYVVVAHEIYEAKPYLKNNPRVISSSAFTHGIGSLMGIIK